MNNTIDIEGISKSYGDVHALKGISLHVGAGEIFGLIGPDGAGKTTLFRIMTTLMLPDTGTGKVCGLDIVKDCSRLRRIIGYMPGKFSLYQDLTVKENLDYFATLFGTTVRDNYENIKEIYSQIEPFADRRAGKLSGGMKQKLALCCALVHRPSVLFLDEPTTGVDAVSRKDFWTMLFRSHRLCLDAVYGRGGTVRQARPDQGRFRHRHGLSGGNHCRFSVQAACREREQDVSGTEDIERDGRHHQLFFVRRLPSSDLRS